MGDREGVTRKCPNSACEYCKKPLISTLKDPQILVEAEKAKLEIDPIDGADIEKMVHGLYEIEPAVLSRVKQILEAK